MIMAVGLIDLNLRKFLCCKALSFLQAFDNPNFKFFITEELGYKKLEALRFHNLLRVIMNLKVQESKGRSFRAFLVQFSSIEGEVMMKHLVQYQFKLRLKHFYPIEKFFNFM